MSKTPLYRVAEKSAEMIMLTSPFFLVILQLGDVKMANSLLSQTNQQNKLKKMSGGDTLQPTIETCLDLPH